MAEWMTDRGTDLTMRIGIGMEELEGLSALDLMFYDKMKK